MRVGALLGGRFELEAQVGTGGMGEVYRGRDRATGEIVAVKLIADGREHRSARFVREVELLAELSHPGIVRYVAHGEMPSGELFLAMEWLDGEDLKDRLERAPLTVGESVALVTRIAHALGAAHARGIVHRDLKPSNLFLPGGRIANAKLIDFGIAQREGGSHLTRTGMLIGTPGYMAPEQARTQGVVDARADVFALGCVLFLCLTGAPAFDGDSAVSVLGKILFGEAPRVSALWPEVPADLDALVARMLANDASLRPADGAALAALLEALGPAARAEDAPSLARALRPSAITGSERRLVSVVVLGCPAGAPALGTEAAEDDALRRAAKPYGGRLEHLADGSTIVVIDAERQVATDQAAQAARCALALRALAPDRPIAVAMGRAASTSKLPEGDLLDRAARLLAQSASGAASPAAAASSAASPPIALDDISAGLLDARFDVAERDAGLVLRGERPLAQGARTLLGRPTACVGRDWELTALDRILDECIEEPEARVVIVTAAAGMGKSRLGTEFISRVRERPEDVAIWVGRGDSLRAGATLDLLAQALRGALGIQGGEPLAERREKLGARVAERFPEAEQQRVAEFLGELVGTAVPDGEETSPQLRAARQDAQLMSEQMRRAFMDFLGAETAAHPVLLVLEDLHWGDFGTVRFIDTALRDRGELPWMVLALARPEVFEVFPKLWADRQNVQEIRLKELGRKAGERLVRQVLGESVHTETIERLVRLADGNTFYLEELIRAVAEGRDSGKDGTLPETVLAMVETRLARLPLEARRVLRAASVFGEVCWEHGAILLLGGAMGPTLVGEWLARLIEQEVLAVRPQSRFPGERELAFRHALLREGAYAALTEEDKRLGHRLAGEWLEQRGEADPMVLAGHFERGGDGARAAAYYLRAAEQAFHVVDLDTAMMRAGQGLAAGPSEALRIALLGIRCEVSAYSLQMLSVTRTDGEELMQLAPPGSVPWAQGLIAYIQGMIAYSEGTVLAGRMDDLMTAIRSLRQADAEPEAAGRMTFAFLASICILDNLGRVADGTALEERFRAMLRGTGDRDPVARFWGHVVLGLRASYAHDDPWTGLANSEAIQPLYDVLGGDRLFLNMELFRGLNLWYLGAADEAEARLAAIEAADTSVGMASSLRRFALAWLLADRGALEEARALAAQLAEYGHAHHLPMEEGRGRWVLAEVLRRMGDLDGAEREIRPALEMAVPLEHPGALATLAAIHAARGRTADALAASETSLARCKEMDGCGLFRGSFIRVVRAEAQHAAGELDAARHTIAEASERLHRIAARIEDAERRRRFLEGVPEHVRIRELLSV